MTGTPRRPWPNGIKSSESSSSGLDYVYASARAEHLQRVKGKFWLVAATFQLWNRSVQGASSQPCGAAQCPRTKPRVSTKTRSA
jgi:hypothetical protein